MVDTGCTTGCVIGASVVTTGGTVVIGTGVGGAVGGGVGIVVGGSVGEDVGVCIGGVAVTWMTPERSTVQGDSAVTFNM
jgi:hypothetical protein